MNKTSFADPLGTAFPPSSGTPGTFQSKPDPERIAPCGYATMKLFASAVAFMPLNASCCVADDPLPCKFKTSGTGRLPV